jgi:hypothetical protein
VPFPFPLPCNRDLNLILLAIWLMHKIIKTDVQFATHQDNKDC